jgi:outer membrane protein
MKKVLLSLAIATLSSSAMAEDADWMIRLRAIDVMPQVSSELSNGMTVKVNDSVVPELDITRFFTPNIAAELILATTKHNLKTNTGIDAGSAWLLPPTLTLQYHFTQWNFAKPYVGAGANYTVFYDERPGALVNVSYRDNFGAVLQAGVDVPISGKWYFNLDAKKLFLSTVAKFNNSAIRADVNLDPWILGAGVGYRF